MLSPLRLEVDPVALGSPWPVDIDLIKSHCRIDDTDQDDVIEVYLAAAITWAENETHRTIFSRAHRWVLKQFPSCGGRNEIRLPRGLTQSVTSIQYSVGGATHTLRGESSGSPAGTDYQEDLGSDSGGVLMPPIAGSWPSADEAAIAPVVLNFMAGWDVDDVPKDIIHALLFFIDDCFELRGSQDFTPEMLATSGSKLAVRELLISSYRMSRWY